MAKSTTLFDKYAKNLTAVMQQSGMAQNVEDMFACPICFRDFPREHLHELRREHVPPESLGGIVKTLTCHECNHFAGHELEHHLKKGLEIRDFEAGSLKVEKDVTIRIDDVRVSGTMTHADNTISMIADLSRSNPDSAKRFFQLATIKPNPVFKMNLRGFDIWRSQVAILRIAYLYAFSMFGYGFMMNPQLEIVRTQIMNPAHHFRKAWGVSLFDAPDEFLGANLVLSPVELQSLMIVFDLKSPSNVSTRSRVLFPGQNNPKADLYDWVAENQGKRFDCTVHHIRDDEVDFVTQPFALAEMWHEFGLN